MFDDLIEQDENVDGPLRDLLLRDVVVEEELHDGAPYNCKDEAHGHDNPFSRGQREDERSLILCHQRQEVKQLRIVRHCALEFNPDKTETTLTLSFNDRVQIYTHYK